MSIDPDLLTTLGREIARLGMVLGVEDACGQDGYEALGRAGLDSDDVVERIRTLSPQEVERFRSAVATVFEVDVPMDQFRDALDRVVWHWSDVQDPDGGDPAGGSTSR